MNELDYENDILLEEDDECPVDYEESNMPNILSSEEIKNLKEQHREEPVGLLDVPANLNYNSKTDDLNYIDYVSYELESNLYLEDTNTSYKQGG